MHDAVEENMAVGAGERGNNSTGQRDLTADRKVRLEWRIGPGAPTAQECLTDRAAHNDAEKRNGCRTGVRVHPAVQRILVPHHVVSGLAIGDNLRETEQGETEMVRDDRLNRSTGPEMKRSDGHRLWESVARPNETQDQRLRMLSGFATSSA